MYPTYYPLLSQVRVEYTPDRGRHLRAARALQLGEVSFPILSKIDGLCNMRTCEKDWFQFN